MSKLIFIIEKIKILNFVGTEKSVGFKLILELVVLMLL